MIKQSVFLAFVLSGFMPAFAQTMYKCPNAAGTVNFQQMPCSPQGGGESVTVKAIPAGSGSGVATDSSEADRMKGLAQQAGSERRLLEISREITSLESQMSGFRSSMSSEMSRLQGKKNLANNNLAGATWEQSISDEMAAVSDKYDSLIRSNQSQIDSLRQERTQLQKP